jgi:hypothetical protein
LKEKVLKKEYKKLIETAAPLNIPRTKNWHRSALKGKINEYVIHENKLNTLTNIIINIEELDNEPKFTIFRNEINKLINNYITTHYNQSKKDKEI